VIEQLRRRLIIGMLIGIAVVLLIVVISDGAAVRQSLRTFDWRLLPAILLLTLFNYALRFVKWQYYLRLLEIRQLRLRDSSAIFLAGFTMVMTPGKVGELLKSYLLRIRTGTPMTRSAPIIVAERVTDGLALLVLAGVGLIAFRNGWQILLASAVAAVIALLIVQHEPTMLRVIAWVGRRRLVHGRGIALDHLYDSTRLLLGPRPFAVGLTLGIISWFGECVAFYLVLIGLGLPHSASLLLAATFVFCAAAWIGGISLLPGGLGVAEASVAGLLLVVVDDPLMTGSLAASATLLIRFATLWFGVLLGMIALTYVSRWMRDDQGNERLDSARAELEGMATAHE
jgi:uncharacterized protein (TIRG00374 family)